MLLSIFGGNRTLGQSVEVDLGKITSSGYFMHNSMKSAFRGGRLTATMLSWNGSAHSLSHAARVAAAEPRASAIRYNTPSSAIDDAAHKMKMAILPTAQNDAMSSARATQVRF
jgi:hypothetical protein